MSPTFDMALIPCDVSSTARGHNGLAVTIGCDYVD